MKTESTFCGLLIKGDNLNSDLSNCFQVHKGLVGANCVRPLMIDNENVVIYTKNAQNRNIFWRPQVAPTVRYDGLCIKQTDKLKLAFRLSWAIAHQFQSVA